MNKENKYIAVEGKAADCEAAISLCGAALQEAGFVREGFAQECILREREYPTGLPTDIPVAIPHCQSGNIIKSGMCYLRLAESVEFHRMDDDEATIFTRHIFNLVIPGGGDHLDFLQQLMGVLSDPAIMSELERTPTDEVPALMARSFSGEVIA